MDAIIDLIATWSMVSKSQLICEIKYYVSGTYHIPSIESSSISTVARCCEKLTTAMSSRDGVREKVMFSVDSRRSSSSINIGVQRIETLGPKVSACR